MFSTELVIESAFSILFYGLSTRDDFTHSLRCLIQGEGCGAQAGIAITFQSDWDDFDIEYTMFKPGYLVLDMVYPFVEHADDPELDLVVSCGEFCDRLDAYLEKYYYPEHPDHQTEIRGLVRELRHSMGPDHPTTHTGLDHVLFFTNRAGRTIVWRRHSADQVQAMIADLQASADPADALIGKVAAVAAQVTLVEEANLTLTDSVGTPVGHIHVQTPDYIIEVVPTLADVDLDQLARLTDQDSPDYLNYFNKPVIYYLPNRFSADPAINDRVRAIQNAGATIVSTPDQLQQALRTASTPNK